MPRRRERGEARRMTSSGRPMRRIRRKEKGREEISVVGRMKNKAGMKNKEEKRTGRKKCGGNKGTPTHRKTWRSKQQKTLG